MPGGHLAAGSSCHPFCPPDPEGAGVGRGNQHGEPPRAEGWAPRKEHPPSRAIFRPPSGKDKEGEMLVQHLLLARHLAAHSRILAWEIPWTEEPGGLQSTGSQRVGHD